MPASSIDPAAGLKDGWRWLAVVDEFGAEPGLEVAGNHVRRILVAPRPMVRKSTVQARLIEAGKMDAAYALLTSHPAFFARWFAPDRPRVFCDDPDAVMVVEALDLDPAVILAPEAF